MELWNRREPLIVIEPPGPKMMKFYEDAGLSLKAMRPISERAEGIWIKDPDGNIFMDFISGRCVANVGHRHSDIIKALREQMDKAIHGLTESRIELEKKLCMITPGDFEKKVIYALSGSAANDLAIKLARWSTGKTHIICFTGAYHGVTYGALSVSSYNKKMLMGFGPKIPGIYHMPYPNCFRCPFGHRNQSNCGIACLRYIEDIAFKTYLPPEEVAAVIIEPIAGDAGWVVPPEGYLEGLRSLCGEYDIAFISEEVQTGFGRTGRWFGIDHWNVVPDIVVMGKSMAGGMPLSGVAANAKLFEVNGDLYHDQTMSGHPLGCAAAIANIDIIENEDLLKKAQRRGSYLYNRLLEMMDDYEIIGDVRGIGLLIGVEIVNNRNNYYPAPDFANMICCEAFKRGLYLTHMGVLGTGVLRIAPPLVITEEQCEYALQILDESIKKCEASKS